MTLICVRCLYPHNLVSYQHTLSFTASEASSGFHHFVKSWKFIEIIVWDFLAFFSLCTKLTDDHLFQLLCNQLACFVTDICFFGAILCNS